MQRRINVINVYSDLNNQIDFIVEIENESDIGRAERILEEAYNNWFDIEAYPELQSIPMAEYIEQELNRNHIQHEIYFKQ